MNGNIYCLVCIRVHNISSSEAFPAAVPHSQQTPQRSFKHI